MEDYEKLLISLISSLIIIAFAYISITYNGGSRS